MSKIGISVKINVSKIEKDRLFAGKKGKYLDCTAFIDLDELDQHGNSGMITQDVTKEEKDAGTKGPILGNTKVFWKDSGKSQETYKDGIRQQAPNDNFDDDIPF